MDAHVPGREVKISDVSLSIFDVKKIFQRLENIVHDDGQKEIAKLSKAGDLTDQQWEDRKLEIMKGAFRVTVTIYGDEGSRLNGDDDKLFESPNIPNKIAAVYLTNATAFRWWTNNNPARSFELYLDFSKPKLLDSERIVSSPTPNLSNLKIEADNELWVAGVSEAVFGVLANKKTQYGLLHRAFSYDFGMLILGLPFGLYMAWKLSGFVQSKLGIIHDVLSATAYIYIVVAALWLYRLLFGYTKWAFPTVELKENSSASGKHRVFWYTILVGLLVNFIFEFSK